MVNRRRSSTQKSVRHRASESATRKLDASIERRLARLDSILREIQRALDAQSRRTAALQAQIDHLDAKVRGN